MFLLLKKGRFFIKNFMAEKDEKDTSSHESKIRGRVFSTEQPVSKMAQLLAERQWQPRVLAKGEAVEGVIAGVVSDSVLVDIGAKAEGMIPRKELIDSGEKIEIGAKISAVVAQTEGDSGTVVLTVKKTVAERVWEQLQEKAESNEAVDVKGVGSNRGGLIVEYKGIRGFIPSSHLLTETKSAVNKGLSAKIIEVNKNLNKLVFSEKEAAGESLPKIELPFKIGDTLQVKISKILTFGLLVSLPSGSDGLIHISEISWRKVVGLSDNFKEGQELKAKVISIDLNTARTNLSIKQLEKDPWREAAKKYKVGATFERPVTRSTSYGVFIELEDGIEGLLHSSKIPYGLELKSGDKVKISVDLFNSEQRRVALRLVTAQAEKGNGAGKTTTKQIRNKAESQKKSKGTKTKKNVKKTN